MKAETQLKKSLELLNEFIKDNPEEYNEIIAKHNEQMKAEEILSTKKSYREYTSYYHKKYIIEAMQEYAQNQIEKDRERIEDNAVYIDGSADIEATHNNTPIILD
jgi:hypothetical protein